MEKHILGIDIGTTSLKAAIFTQKGAQLASAVVEYALLTGANAFVEAPCEVYLESIKGCMRILAEKAQLEKIGVMSFSVQGETLVFLGEDARPLCNAIVWMDNRAKREAEMLRERFGDELGYEVTGQVSFEACWPAAKVLWMKRNRPELFAKIQRVLLLEDYIIAWLTGEYVSEGSLLTSTQYWDIRRRKYWPEMLDFLGLRREWLPMVRESGEVVSKILPQAAGELGLAEDVLVCTGCLDQVAGAIGAGNIRPGIFSENIGAALAVCVPLEKLTYDPNRQMPVHYFAIPGTYMLHTFTTGGMCLRWFRDAFCRQEMCVCENTGLDAYFLMDLEAQKAPPGSDGLITLPHLQGAMAPDMNLDAKGVFFGATLAHTRGHFIRSIMESLGYILCRNLEAIREMGIPIDEIRTLGGGSKSDLWNQIKADITGQELRITQSAQDTACLGAAILAGTAVGYFKSVQDACDAMVKIKKTYVPNPENRKVYEGAYATYRDVFSALARPFAQAAQHASDN